MKRGFEIRGRRGRGWLGRTALAALAGLALGASTLAQTPEKPYRETADRLPEAQREALIAAPMALVRQGELDRGQQVFERQMSDVRRTAGADSLEAADLLSAFGVALYVEDHRRAAVDYMRRALEIYRVVFGPRHAEVALALTDYAKVRDGAEPVAGDPGVVADLEEAYRMRLDLLGAGDAETVMSLAYLGEAKGKPARTGRDPARIAEAVALLRRAYDGLDATPNKQACDRPAVRLKMAELYALNGMAATAWEHFEAYEREACSTDDEDAQAHIRRGASFLRDDFLAVGLKDQADLIVARYLAKPPAKP